MPNRRLASDAVTYAGKRLSTPAVERQRTAARVRAAAVRRLVANHREEFDQYVKEEWARTPPPPSELLRREVSA
jgi:hypothetical protein